MSAGNLGFVFTLKFNVEVSKWSEFQLPGGCRLHMREHCCAEASYARKLLCWGFMCDKTAVLRLHMRENCCAEASYARKLLCWGFICDKLLCSRTRCEAGRSELLSLRCSVFLDVSTLKMRTLLSTDQEVIPARYAIDAHAQDFVVNEVSPTRSESIITVHSFATHYSKCLMFSLCMQQ
jgi:hypothetical protein